MPAQRFSRSATAPPWYSQPPRARLGALGIATGVVQEASLATVGAKAGATAGSVVPGVGTAIGAAVGAVVGAVVGILTRTNNTASHIGSWDGGLTQAIGSLPASAAGIGRQIPWNENSHGLVQMIEALLAVGVYMAWDTSLKSSYDVAAHWAMTFGAAIQSLAQSIVASPVGKTASVSIALAPGAGGHPPFTFNYVNPGVQVGPDKISATVVMGSSGLMGAMMIALGGQAQQNIVSNENNALAQKVYALMLDYWFAQLAPAAAQPTKPVPPTIAPAVAAASVAANNVAATVVKSTVQPIAIASSQQPAVDNSAALMQQLIAQGASQNAAMLAAMQQLESQGINSQAPAVQQQLQSVAPSGLFGLSSKSLLLIGGVVVAAIMLSKEPKS